MQPRPRLKKPIQTFGAPCGFQNTNFARNSYTDRAAQAEKERQDTIARSRPGFGQIYCGPRPLHKPEQPLYRKWTTKV